MKNDNPENNYLNWLDKAGEDELSAKAVLKEGAPSTGCFLSQQMAEKLLKGLLVANNREFPKIHDLLRLETLLAEFILDINTIHNELVLLTNYYVETRYPGDYPQFTHEECREAFKTALKVKEFVLKKIGG